MKMKKRLISIAMAAVMAVGSIPAAGALLDGFNNTSTYRSVYGCALNSMVLQFGQIGL